MRVTVKNMSGIFIHSTTPRKARLLLKEKKAVIESNNPFTIRLLFSESECGLKDSKPKTHDNTVSVLSETYTDIKSTKDYTMRTENNVPKIITSVSNKNFPDDHILYLDRSNSSDFMRCYGIVPSFCMLYDGDARDYPYILELSSSNNLSFLKYAMIKEDDKDSDPVCNFDVYLFQIIKQQDGFLYKFIIFYINLGVFISCPSFLVTKNNHSVNNVIKWVARKTLDVFAGYPDSKKWCCRTIIVNAYDSVTKDVLYSLKKQVADMKENYNFDGSIEYYDKTKDVLEFSAYECGLKDSFLQQNKSDLVSEKENTMCDEKISLEVEQEEQKHNFTRRTTHLIFGYYGCGKTTYIRQLINDKIQNCLGVCVLTNAYSAKLYFNKEDKNLHIFTIADILTFLPDKEKNPTNIAKAIVDCFVANVGRFNIDTIAVDGMDVVIPSINSDYSEDEYFRELSKRCKENKFNLLYTKGINKIENDSSYHKIPTIFERFSDIITVIKQQNKSDNNKSENENTMCEENTLLAVERRDCMEFNYEIKVFYVQYNVSFLVSEIPLDSVVSEEDAIKEGKKYRDIYDELLTKDRSYLSMPDTEVKLLIIKRHRDGGLPITIGYLGIFKGYDRCPDMGSSEFEMDRIDEFYKDYK